MLMGENPGKCPGAIRRLPLSGLYSFRIIAITGLLFWPLISEFLILNGAFHRVIFG